LAWQLKPRDAPWLLQGALDTIPVAEVGPGGPIAQGSVWIIGDAQLEVEQWLQIDAALMNG